MRRNWGAQKKIVAMRVAVWATVGVITASAVPVAAQSQPAPSGQTAGTQQLSSGASVATDLFKSLAEGAAGQVGGAAAGWAMSAIGLSSGTDYSGALAEINEDLNEIINELSSINQELAQLTAAIQQLDCDSLASATLSARGLIDSLSTTYQTFLDTAAGTYGNAEVPSIPDMTTWAEQVTDSESGVFAQIAIINDALLPAGSAQGILQSCLQPGVIAPPAPGEIDDRTYYGEVQNLTNFWYLYQARGLLLLQEAYHFLAQQASGQTGDPADPGDVCTSATDSEVVTLCTSGIEDTNQVYSNLGQQLTLAGAPYSDDYILSMQGGAGYSPVIWVTSLEDFTQSNGGGCTYPLTSFGPCGITVGDQTTASNRFDVIYRNYGTWAPANVDNLIDLVQGRGSQTAAEYLQSKGFVNLANKVVVTPNTFTFTLWGAVVTGTAMCFLDMDLTAGAICDQQSLLDNIVEEEEQRCQNVSWYVPYPSLPQFDFYKLKLYPAYECQPNSWFWDPTPGWLLSSNYGSGTGQLGEYSSQFRWPVTHGGSLSCTQGRSSTNPGGVYTRCGQDFDSWFNEQVTRPVTCAGTIVGVCGDQVYVALSGPQPDEWSSPLLGGDVSVTFDGKTVRRITGTVELAATNGSGTATVTFNVIRAGGKHDFYQGTVKIQVDGQVLVVPLQRAELKFDADGTVSGQLVYRRDRHGTYTLTWSVLDNPA